MQIVIDIPKEKYELCKRWKPSERHELQEAVANGILLPENHGRLIDADALKADAQTMTEWNGDVFRCVTERTIDLADTMIPSMKGEDGEDDDNR